MKPLVILSLPYPNQGSSHYCYFLSVSLSHPGQPPKFFYSEQNQASQAVYSKPQPSTTNHITGGGGGGKSSPEEVEVLLSNQKAASQKPSFLCALIKAFGPYFLIGSGFKLLQDVITFVNPQLLR